MYEKEFADFTTVKSQTQLQRIFNTNDLYLEENSEIEFSGKIRLYNGINFRGINVFRNNTVIDSYSILSNVDVGEGTHIRSHSLINDSKIGKNGIIGPFCFIRDNCNVGNQCIVGSYVEMARSVLGDEVKISHQAFVADAVIGSKVIVGAGTVFCNFDGSAKQSSKIASNVTIGSGTMIVAPIFVEEGVIVGAGSVISKNIEKYQKVIQKRK